MVIFGRGKQRPSSKAAKYTATQPGDDLSTVSVELGTITQKFRLKENFTSKFIPQGSI